MSQDIFAEISSVMLDLQASQAQAYERYLKKLVQLLKHVSLEPYNNKLVANLNLSSFLEKSEQSVGSMVESVTLDWSDNPGEELGLTLLLVWKLGADPSCAAHFSLSFFYSGSKIISNIRAPAGQLTIPFIRDYKIYILSGGIPQTTLTPPPSKKAFIVHGHDEGSREKTAHFLGRIDLEAIILHGQVNRGCAVIEKVIEYSSVGFVIVLLTPDDEGCIEGGALEPKVCQNVFLELGSLIGHLERDRVCALKRGAVEIPNDFAGVVWEHTDDNNGWKQSLSRELEAAGYTIDWNRVMR